MGFGGGLTKITAQSQIANALLGDPLMAAGGVSTADLATDTRAYWGRWLKPNGRSSSGTNQAITANRGYIIPLYVPRKMTFDQLTLQMPTAGNGNTIAGIYADNTDTPVGGALSFSYASIPTLANTIFTINTQLAQGLYWLVIMFSSAVDQFGRYTNVAEFPTPFSGARYDTAGFALTDPCPAITSDSSASPELFLRIKTVDA